MDELTVIERRHPRQEMMDAPPRARELRRGHALRTASPGSDTEKAATGFPVFDSLIIASAQTDIPAAEEPG